MLQLEGFVFGVSLHSASLMIDLRCACLIKKINVLTKTTKMTQLIFWGTLWSL